MFINFWYPVCKSEELNEDAPRRVELLGLQFVAFRNEAGAAHVLSDTCVHRGGALGLGKLVEGRVQCPYHGWQFSGDGHCARIPSMPDTAPPARAKVDSYPVEERYGVVFAFLGDLPAAERPPVCPVPEYGQDGWRASEIVVLEIDAYYERSMENGLDPAHNEFVHPRQGFPPMLAESFEIHDDPWGAGFWADFGDPVLELTEFAKDRNRTGELRAGSWFHGPNGLVTSIFVNKDSNLVQYLFEAPVNDSHTRIFFLNMRNWLLDPDKDERFMQTNLRIVHEDIGILEALWPVRTPATLTREIMTPSDQVVVRFREQLADWRARGWQIDRHAVHDKHGDVAYAIPCPDRRTSGNWVLEAIPLFAPEN